MTGVFQQSTKVIPCSRHAHTEHTSLQSARYMPERPPSSGDVAANTLVAAPCSRGRSKTSHTSIQWHLRPTNRHAASLTELVTHDWTRLPCRAANHGKGLPTCSAVLMPTSGVRASQLKMPPMQPF